MPTVPLPLLGTADSGDPSWLLTYPVSAGYTGKWIVALSVGSNPYSAAASAVNCSPTGEGYPVPSERAEWNVVARHDDPQGCSVVPMSAPFVIGYTLADVARSPYMGVRFSSRVAVNFTYPDEWDDVAFELSRVRNDIFLFTRYFVLAEVGITWRKADGTQYTRYQYLQTTLPRLDLLGTLGSTANYRRYQHFMRQNPGQSLSPADYKAFANGGFFNDLEIEIQAGFPASDLVTYGDTPAAIPCFGLYYLVDSFIVDGTLETRRQHIVVGGPWAEHPRPTITWFLWKWGDGTPNGLALAGPTGYERIGPGAAPDPNLVGEGDTFLSYSASMGEAIGHKFEAKSAGVYVRSVDSFGRMSPWYPVKGGDGSLGEPPLTFEGDDSFSAVHNAHGEVFMARTETDREKPQGAFISRSAGNASAATAIVFIPDIKKPRLFVEASNMLGLCAISPGGIWALYSTPDSGETWKVMTKSPFDGETYSLVVPCNGMLHGQAAVVAVQKEGNGLYFSLYNGASWTEPAPISGFSSAAGLAFFQENFAGSSRLRLIGKTFDICSLDCGTSWNSTP